MSEIGLQVVSAGETVGLQAQEGDTVSLAVVAADELVSLEVLPDEGGVGLVVEQLQEAVSLHCEQADGDVHLQINNSGDVVNLSVEEGVADEPGWSDFVTRWDVQPALAATIPAGGVFTYQLDGVTRYRLVPSPYSPAADAFYTGFTGGVLSGLLAARG